MKVHCRTNLDLLGEEWPTDLPAVPNVGDLIQSKTKHGVFQLRLKVIKVTWQFHELVGVYKDNGEWAGEWRPEIELHDYCVEPRSIEAFYEWYAPLVGRTVSSFI